MWPSKSGFGNQQSFSGVTSGQTLVVPSTNQDTLVSISAAGTLASLTLTLPPDAATAIGQQIRIYTSVAVTAFTVNGETNIYGAPTSLNAQDNFGFQKVAPNTFTLIGIS